MKPYGVYELKDFTIIAHFEDPAVPQALKELMYKDENNRLMALYEESLPTWTIELASNTPLYRSWMRYLVKYYTIIISFVTLFLALYDLYESVPVLRNFVDE